MIEWIKRWIRRSKQPSPKPIFTTFESSTVMDDIYLFTVNEGVTKTYVDKVSGNFDKKTD